MAGVTQHPDRPEYLELGKRIQVAGGKLLTQRHVGVPIKFPEANSEYNRTLAERDATTCGCGDTRQVMIPYEHEASDRDGNPVDGQRVERRYVACVNCDGVALQPRWGLV